MKVNRFLFGCLLITGSLSLYTCDTKNSIDPVFKNYFIKYYGEDGSHEAKDFIVNDDGTVIIVGTVTFGQTETVQTKRVYIVKTDLEGNELWNKTLGSDFNEEAADIEPIIAGSQSGNFLILSNLTVNQEISNIRLTVINANGDSLTSYLISEFELPDPADPENLSFVSNSFEGRAVSSVPTGAFFISGYADVNSENRLNAGMTSPPTVLTDLLVITLDNNFDIKRFDQIGGSYDGLAQRVNPVVGIPYLYAGSSDDGTLNSNNQYQSDFFFRLFSDNPSGVSSVLAGSGSMNEKMYCFSAKPLFNTYCAIGTQSDFNGANRKAYAAVVSSTLSSVIAEGVVLSGANEYEGVAVAAASTSYMMLANEINAANKRDIFFVKMSTGLVPEFNIKFGAVDNDDRGAAVAELPNGDILILGTMQLAGQQDKIALIKLRPNGTF